MGYYGINMPYTSACAYILLDLIRYGNSFCNGLKVKPVCLRCAILSLVNSNDLHFVYSMGIYEWTFLHYIHVVNGITRIMLISLDVDKTWNSLEMPLKTVKRLLETNMM